MRRGSLVVLLAAGLGVGMTSLALAQQKGAKGIVAIRQATMDANGGHMSAIKFILTESPDLLPQVMFHAEAISQASGYTDVLFPKGSDQGLGPTAALPAVWEKPDEFKQAGERARSLADKLAEVAKDGDAKATLAAFATLGKEGCGGCHQTFRKKDN
jgi:cytochrome c556